MATYEDYTSGTVSIANGSTALTGAGTAWATAGLKAGDEFWQGGFAVVIASVDSETAITLKDAWPGATLSGAAYLIRFQQDGSRVQATTRNLLDQLSTGFSLVGTSTTSLAIGTGSKTFTIKEDNRGWGVGQRLRAASDADGSNYMEGVITAYSANSLTLNVDLVGGTGTFADWTISLAGEPGSAADMAALTHAATSKTTPVDADELPLVDSAAAFGLKKLTWANLKAAIKAGLSLRGVLTANRTYYVRTTGSDSNDGLTAATAFLTVQKAVSVVSALDLSIYQVTIDVGAGNFAENVTLRPWVGQLPPLISGAGSGSTTITGVTAVNTLNGCTWRVENLGFGNAGSYAIRGTGPGVINFANVDFGGTGRSIHIYVDGGFTAIATGNFSISASATLRFAYAVSAMIQIALRTVTITANLTFSCFVLADVLGHIDGWSMTFTLGAFTVTGQRYSATGNAVVHSGGGGANYFPGSTAGAVATGGQYL